jgi:outer membrane protein
LLDLQRRNVEVLQEQLRQTRDRSNVGEVTRTDVAQTEAQLAQGRATVLTAEAQYVRSRAAYRQFIGVEAGTLQPAAPVDRLTPRSLLAAIGIARARHPNVGVAMFGIDAAVLQVKVTEGSLYPQASLVGTVGQGWGTNPPVILQQFNAFVAAQVTIPIYNAGPTGVSDTFSAIRAAKETVGQKRMDLETARDQVQAAVVTAWGQLEAARAQILATQAGVAAAEIALDGVRQEARVGQRTTFDILLQQQTLVNARVALVTAQHDRVVASYALLAAVGEFNLPKVGIHIPLYDPTVHYRQVRDAWIGVRTPDGR